MKALLLTLFFAVSLVLAAQSNDVLWFDANWNAVSSKKAADFYRVIEKDALSDRISMIDYYITGKIYRRGFFITLAPEIRDGKFIWYYKNGKIQKEATYEGNVLIDWKVLNNKGLPELAVAINFKGANGEDLSEPMKVEKNPEFPGGKKALAIYTRKNLVYPPITTLEPLIGTVFVYFVVKEDGSISDVKLAKSLHRELDAEAVNFVKKMPAWIPAKVGDTPVAVSYILPVEFANKSAQDYTVNKSYLP